MTASATQGPSNFEPGTGVMPAFDGFNVSPSDSANLVTVARALFIGIAGNVKLQTLSGASLNFQNLQGGSILPVQCIQVFNTSTTATNIIALV